MLTNDVNTDIEKLLETQGAGIFIKSKAGAPTAIPNQLVAFEKLQRHAISRFSKERVYNMLKTVMQHLRSENKQKEQENAKNERKSAEKEQKAKGNSPDSDKSKDDDSGRESVSKDEQLTEKKDKSPEVSDKDQNATTNNENENKKQFVKADIKIQSVKQVRETSS
ncbi:hypothetical protein KUTeg_008078 [Tegillarca granosa]|uniref:Uncharacterized protein n=1 Tax=Tegillarca granosa TaxID=220873 RepID=A0ABQ9FAX2_TEGGR|nr:hypothetical protein KUTeg_008078 [Tegillarca granosa]